MAADNETLFQERPPMTAAFMALVSSQIVNGQTLKQLTAAAGLVCYLLAHRRSRAPQASIIDTRQVPAGA